MSTPEASTDVSEMLLDTVKNYCINESNFKSMPIKPCENNFKSQWKSLSKLGLLGIGQHFTAMQEPTPHQLQWDIIRILSKYNPGIGLSYLAHNILITYPLQIYQHNAWHNFCLQKLMLGQIGCCAISEPGAGSDVMAMRTTARENADCYILSGEKTWITNGPYADFILVYAKINRHNSRDLAVFILDAHSEGITKSKPMHKIGMQSSPTGTLIFDNVRIPKHCRLDSGRYSAKKVLFQQLDYERLMLAAGPVGIMDWCYDQTESYLQTRRQFGQPIGRFQLLQGHMADIFTSLHASEAYVEKCINLYINSQLDQKTAASVYLFCSEEALKVADVALQCAGAHGYMHETQYGQYWQDAKLYTIGGGTSEIRRWVIGRSILG